MRKEGFAIETSSYEDEKLECAALAFHKSLICLSQLDALEKAAGPVAIFLGARGLFVYETVYHLFCACILIAPKKYAVELKSLKDYGKVSDEELDNPSESPKQWENGKIYESDFATIIKHKHVKDFCVGLRKCPKEDWNQDAPYLSPLYHYFVDDTNSEEKCIPGLYEKLCYIRDRTLYRPSHVLTASGRTVQTSAQLGSELRSLPNAEYLYCAITEVYTAMLRQMEREWQVGERGTCIRLLTKMWSGKVNEGDLSDLCALGHPRERLQELGECDESEEYTLPAHISHLLEMESTDFVFAYQKKYWEPLEKTYQDSWERLRRRK